MVTPGTIIEGNHFEHQLSVCVRSARTMDRDEMRSIADRVRRLQPKFKRRKKRA